MMRKEMELGEYLMEAMLWVGAPDYFASLAFARSDWRRVLGNGIRQLTVPSIPSHTESEVLFKAMHLQSSA